MQTKLVEIQPQFRESLVTNVVLFQQDSTQYYHDYNTVSTSGAL